MTKFLALLLVTICVSASFAVNNSEKDTSTVVERFHPKLFELVTSWDSDTDQPVVTEINLDAVVKNRNQFDFTKVKKNGDWIECPGDDGCGFRRFKIIKADQKQFLIEFQRNAGGTLTTPSLIEFVIDTRHLLKAGKSHPVQVLRIMSIEAR
jgi:hypothetical protein